MVRIEGKKIIMDKGDYGLPVPFRFVKNNGQVLSTDKIVFKIKTGDEEVLVKEYTNLQKDHNGNLVFVFELTKDESQKLDKDIYVYEIEVYRGDYLLSTFVNNEIIELI